MATDWQTYAPVFAALGDQTRLSLVVRLGKGQPCSITQLTAGSGLTRQAVTKHLRVLQSVGLVHALRSGRESRFELDSQPIDEMRQYLARISEEWDQRLVRLKSFVENEEIKGRSGMATEEEILTAAYRSFNARDVDHVLSMMSPDVDWANGMTGGRVHGHGAVREYWTGQWAMVNPQVEPVGFQREKNGRVAVSVHQVVRDLKDNLLMDRMVEHVYTIKDSLIQRMDIRELPTD